VLNSKERQAFRDLCHADATPTLDLIHQNQKDSKGKINRQNRQNGNLSLWK
jgi:hypothetical protein